MFPQTITLIPRSSSFDGREPLAVPRHLLPAAAALGHRQEVHGRLRNVGQLAEGPDRRAGVHFLKATTLHVPWCQSYDREYNASAAKIYNTTSSLVRFENKNFLL
jgi:hypothetical protein